MKFYLIDKINSPKDVKALNFQELSLLCGEIRAFLIENVSQTGGHLSSNLGTVELTVALHKVFSTPKDKLVWDVGHQCYTHKIITGRKEGFKSLRMLNGVCGFPVPKESEHDAFVAGHGSMAISVAIGIARAKKLKGEAGKVIAIVGDGAFTGGMIYEAMNNIGVLNNLIVILNDNNMSISKNVGSVAQYLTQLRTSPGYFKAKRDVESILNSTPLIGKAIKSGIQSVKSAFRRSIYHSTFFEELGFQYVGPVDGHNLSEMCNMFGAFMQDQSGPLIIHAVTIKGKGYKPAEQNPGAFHGVSSFNADDATDPDISTDDSFSNVFGEELAAIAQDETKICAITAAMKYGTGLSFFYKQHKDRFFDVGMAEQHAVTFAAGLAKEGFIPAVAIYSTFLQRAYDQIIHDVNLQQLNVLFCVDRAGLVPNDGETHQGIYDTSYLSQLDNFKIVSPCNYVELKYWLKKYLLYENTPRAIRYPRGNEDPVLSKLECTGREYDCIFNESNSNIAIITYGDETVEALLAARIAKEKGKAVHVYKLTVINPLPSGFVKEIMKYNKIIFAEQSIKSGSIGEHLAAKLCMSHFEGEYLHVALPNLGITHAKSSQLKEMFGLDAKNISNLIN